MARCQDLLSCNMFFNLLESIYLGDLLFSQMLFLHVLMGVFKDCIFCIARKDCDL